MKVLAMDKTAEEGLTIIRNAGIECDSKAGLSEEELIKIIPEYDALIVRSETKVTPKILEAGKNLKISAFPLLTSFVWTCIRLKRKLQNWEVLHNP